MQSGYSWVVWFRMAGLFTKCEVVGVWLGVLQYADGSHVVWFGWVFTKRDVDGW